MKLGFDFEIYGTVFKNCFIEVSRYVNGNLQLSLYGHDPDIRQITHLIDITLDQNIKQLPSNQIIVNDRFNPTLVSQLKDLGILKDKLDVCIINNHFYSIYSFDFSKVEENCYYLQELVAA